MKSVSARIADELAVRVQQVDAAVALTMKLRGTAAFSRLQEK